MSGIILNIIVCFHAFIMEATGHVMSHVLSHVMSQEKSHTMSQSKSHVKSHSCKSHS